ncbi:MAG: hypothetical protein WD114_02295 [Phycisphaerales bacterium]
MNTHTLTPDLFHDLLTETISTLDICVKHELSLEELAKIVEGPEFKQAVTHLESIAAARARAKAPLLRESALRTLESIAVQEPTSPTHAETIRKAAGLLYRSAPTPEPVIEASNPTTNPNPNPKPTTDSIPTSPPGREASAPAHRNGAQPSENAGPPAQRNGHPAGTSG